MSYCGTYCGTLAVMILSQVQYQQLGFGNTADYQGWIQGTLIPQAGYFIDNYVGHNFCQNVGTIVLDGSGKEVQHVSRVGLVDDGGGLDPPQLLPLPLVGITQITVDGSAISGYQVYDSFVSYEDNCFDCGRQNIRLMGTWGYTAVPDDVAYVCAQLCTNVINSIIRSELLPDLVTPILEGSGDLGALFRSPKVLTANEKEILNRYMFREIEVG